MLVVNTIKKEVITQLVLIHLLSCCIKLLHNNKSHAMMTFTQRRDDIIVNINVDTLETR